MNSSLYLSCSELGWLRTTRLISNKFIEWLVLLKKVTRSQDLTQHLLGLVSTLAVTRPPFFGDFPIQLDELFVYPYTSNNLRTSF